eukprot:gene15657-17560_t
MNAFNPFLISLFLLLLLHLISSYTIEEILKDHDIFLKEWKDLIKYRGPILENVWMNFNDSSNNEKEVCDRLFQKSLEIKNITWPPPVNPPSDLMDWYTMGGRARYDEWYVVEEDVGNGGKGYNWTRAVMEEARSKENTCGMYHTESCAVMMDRYASVMKGKSSLVMGSGQAGSHSGSPRYRPWAEAALFNANVSHVTTVEPIGVKISSDYENFTSLELSEVGRRYLERRWEGVDVAFSFSSLKHEGLGRLGEPLNPFGDLESVGRIRCLLKPGGLLFVGFPMSADEVWWNGHRLYGRYRLFLLLLGWRVVDLYPENCLVDPEKASSGYWGCQPVMLLQKTDVLKPSDVIQSLKPKPKPNPRLINYHDHSYLERYSVSREYSRFSMSTRQKQSVSRSRDHPHPPRIHHQDPPIRPSPPPPPAFDASKKQEQPFPTLFEILRFFATGSFHRKSERKSHHLRKEKRD